MPASLPPDVEPVVAPRDQRAVRVVNVTDDIAEPVALFFRTTWGATGTASDIRAARASAAATNPVSPGVDPPAVAYLRGDEVLGYLGTIPVKFWNGVEEVPAYWLKGFMVHPDHRNGPVGFAVLKELIKQLPVSGIMTVALPARRLFGAVGYVDCGTLPNYLTPLRAERIASNLDLPAVGLRLPGWVARAVGVAQSLGVAYLGGVVVNLGIGAWRAAHHVGTSLRVDDASNSPSIAELDDLWASTRGAIANGAVRDGAFLDWRYRGAERSLYEGVAVRDRKSNRLAGVAFVRRPRDEPDPRLKGIKVATLSDVLFNPADRGAGVAVVAAAEAVAVRMGADALLCSAAHAAILDVLRRRGALPLPGNVHLMMRDSKSAARVSTDVREWWITRGDASSDGAF